MPIWFQWTLFVVLAFHAVWWGYLAVISAEDERAKQFSTCRIAVALAMIVCSIAALTLWFIAGGGK